MKNLKKNKKTTKKIKDSISDIYTLFNSGKLDETISRSLILIKENPNISEIHNILGVSYSLRGHKDLSIKHLKEVLKLEPSNAEANNNLGGALIENLNYDEAIKFIDIAIRIKPDFPNPYYNRGVFFQKKGKITEAILSYKKAIDLKKDYLVAYNNLGNCFKYISNFKEAIYYYNKAIELDKNNPSIYYNMGIAYQKINSHNKAVICYNKAISLNPNLPLAYYNLGNSLKLIGEIEKAIESYYNAAALNPNSEEIYFNLGNVLEQSDKLIQSIDIYKNVLKINPNNLGACNNLGNVYFKLQKIEDAIKCYSRVLKLDPTNKKMVYLINALKGNTVSTAPLSYVEKLFDDYANKFDESLSNLDYLAPKKISEIIKELIINYNKASILDLGCGTGLIGNELKDKNVTIEGIDLSKKMLKQAKLKNVYNKLYKNSITEFLSRSDLNFDIFVSSDVFIYIGELSQVFSLIKKRNRNNGYLIFSTEHTESAGYVLEKSARFSHSKEYIEILCDKYEYKLERFEKFKLRKETGKYIIGGIYLLKF